MAKGDDLQQRLIQYGARIVRVCQSLPNSVADHPIASQLVRCGTAAAAHHAESQSAESANDFVHKLKIGVKELNESEVWLHLIVTSELLPASQLTDLLDETDQLQKIISASIRTARHSIQADR